MSGRIKINELLVSEEAHSSVLLKGWIRTLRESKEFSFIEVNDGSCLANIQVIVDNVLGNYSEIVKLTTGASISVEGELVESLGKGQKWEIRADSIEILGVAPDDFPLQKKRHTDEYLRTIAHLRPRSNKYSAIFRIRSKLSFAIHQFFQERDFQWIHTPIITGSDCEGAGEMFSVTTLDMNDIPKKDGVVDYEKDFFGKGRTNKIGKPINAKKAITKTKPRCRNGKI